MSIGKKHYLWRHPRGYWYVRVRGRYFRIIAAEDTEEFDRQYWDILTGKGAEAHLSFRRLIASYRQTGRWASLKPRTHHDYEKVLTYLDDQIGDRDIKTLKRRDIIATMQANQGRVRFGNYIQQVLSVLYEHAIDIGWAETNPAKSIRKLQTPPEKRRPHVPWPDWAVDRFRAEASTLPLLIFELGLGSVQRPGDWPRFRWSDYDGASLKITQGKTGKTLWLPCTNRLRPLLDRTPRIGLTILTNHLGASLSYFSMARIMRFERERLELTEFDLHALRYRSIMELAWADCSDDEIAAFSGHASREMIRKYAGEARQQMRARSAHLKRSRT